MTEKTYMADENLKVCRELRQLRLEACAFHAPFEMTKDHVPYGLESQ